MILALDVQDLYGSLTTHNRTTRLIEYVIKPSAKIIHISLNEMLVHSWATDYQTLQAVDVPICADTSLALPELTQLCRQMMGEGGKKKASIEARYNEAKSIHDKLRFLGVFLAQTEEFKEGGGGLHLVAVSTVVAAVINLLNVDRFLSMGSSIEELETTIST